MYKLFENLLINNFCTFFSIPFSDSIPVPTIDQYKFQVVKLLSNCSFITGPLYPS